MKGSFRIGEWLIRPELGRIASSRKSVRVEPKVMRVLEVLAESGGEMVPREDLIGKVWPGVFVTDDVLTRCISVLRRVFEDSRSQPQVIETISKRGYRLVAPVQYPEARRDAHRLLAVLPFSTPDGDAEAASLSEVLTEALIETLTDVPRLRVKAWSSVLRFQRDADDPLSPARALGAHAALVGRIIRRGDRLTIFTELVDVTNGWRLWGSRYSVDAATEVAPPAILNLARQISGNVREKLIARETVAASSDTVAAEELDESQWHEVLEPSPT